MMRLLVTRPQSESERTAAALRARGHEAVVAPLLRIEPVTGTAIDPQSVSAILMTSANAARAVAAHPRLADIRHLPVLAVGRQTAEAARAVGFADVVSADGDAAALAALAVGRFGARAARLLYLAGSDRARDLAADLAPHGVSIETAVVYRATAVETLPAEARTALAASGLAGVLHYSARTAAIFVQCAARDGLIETVRGLGHYCLSRRVAQALHDAGFERVLVAARPDEAAMLDLLASS